jgi:molybdate transport system substrate-binding protein
MRRILVSRLVFPFCVLAALLAGCGTGTLQERRLDLAVSANFAAAARRLAEDFGRQHACTVALATASSGKLSAQIQNGAPFDLFLSADTAYPGHLHRIGKAEPLRIYAYGRLVAWSTVLPAMPPVAALCSLQGEGRIGIAQPETAPYGRAAEEVLRRLGHWEALQDRLVIAESIAQLNLYIESGQVDWGLSAYSAVQGREALGVWTLVPDSLHAPIAQGFAVLPHGRRQHAALVDSFAAYIGSPEAQAIIAAHGYTPVASQETK